MNVKSTIEWATPYSLGLVLALAIVAFAGFALLRWSSGRPIGIGPAARALVLRLAILAILGVIIINPVRVDETPGIVERPRLFYLLDTSQSMAIGKQSTRWDQVVQTLRDAEGTGDPRARAQISTFQFGSGLAAVHGDFWRPEKAKIARGSSAGAVLAAEAPRPGERPPAPTDPDTLLGASLESLAHRFGQTPPQAVVVFSDGRRRDSDKAGTIARAYSRMKVPVHVFPVGDENVGGDVAIVSMVVPNQVRKFSTIAAQVFVRSFGYKGQRAELKIVAVGRQGNPDAVLDRTPIVLDDGLADYSLAFESGDQDHRIEARIEPQPGEVSASNNAFGADLAIDHTKIRVLYLEGATDRYVAQAVPSRVGGVKSAGRILPARSTHGRPGHRVHGRLAWPGRQRFLGLCGHGYARGGLPDSPSVLFAYDAIILSNVARDALSDQHLVWIEDWIGRRAGGLCMVGGPNSFASGRWNDTSVGKMLPVELGAAGMTGMSRSRRSTRPPTGAIHPVWHISSDEAQNRSLLKTLPSFGGSNRIARVKPEADVLARIARPGVAGEPDARTGGSALRPGPHDGHDHGDHSSLGKRIHAVVGRARRSLLQEVLAQRRLLADRKLVHRPPPSVGRNRQAAVSAG